MKIAILVCKHTMNFTDLPRGFSSSALHSSPSSREDACSKVSRRRYRILSPLLPAGGQNASMQATSFRRASIISFGGSSTAAPWQQPPKRGPIAPEGIDPDSLAGLRRFQAARCLSARQGNVKKVDDFQAACAEQPPEFCIAFSTGPVSVKRHGDTEHPLDSARALRL